MKKYRLMGLAAAFFLGVGAVLSSSDAEAQAVTWPTFELDLAASSVEVESAGCMLSCTGFRGSFGQGAQDFSWTPASASESIVVDDFFNWTATSDRVGLEDFSVQADLVFSSPDTRSANANGNGLAVQLWGDLTGGILRWTDATSVMFAQGSTLDIAFEGFSTIWNGSISTGATFIGNLIEPVSTGSGSTAAVPLPGSLVLLLSAFGSFFVGSRVMRGSRRTAGAAA